MLVADRAKFLKKLYRLRTMLLRESAMVLDNHYE